MIQIGSTVAICGSSEVGPLAILGALPFYATGACLGWSGMDCPDVGGYIDDQVKGLSGSMQPFTDAFDEIERDVNRHIDYMNENPDRYLHELSGVPY